jgi:2-polyprenyl-6-methoxyphenol hydroxylase-like FAD-dependent oxidoreductase
VKVVCVGGGPAGLFAALLLKQRHPAYDVEVVERNPEGHTQGWGVVLWQDGLDAVAAADAATGRALQDACFRWQGLRVERWSEHVLDDAAHGFAIARRELLAILAARAVDAGVAISYDREVDPAALPAADLVVVADGVGSKLRRAYATEFGTRIEQGGNRYAWLGVSACLQSFVFAFVKTKAGWLWCHGYGHAGDSSTFVVECQAETWEGLGLQTKSTDETLQMLESLFAPQLAGGRLLPPPGSDDRISWLRFGTLTNETWHHDRLVLLGDAAHTTHFSIGSGTKLAMKDAAALVDALDLQSDIPAALTAYEASRRKEVAQAQLEAAHSQRWFENPSRYSEIPMPDFLDLLHRRRSSLQGRISPRAYLRLRRLADSKSTVQRLLRRLRTR